MSAEGSERRVLIHKWMLSAACCTALWTVAQPGYGQADTASGRPTPKAWIQRCFGVDFPKSAKHFVLYYRSLDEDVVLFSFDIDQGDLQRLMDGRSMFPRYGDLTTGGPGVPSGIVRDWGSTSFAKRVSALLNSLSGTRTRANGTEPREVRVWTAERTAGIWQVCVSVTTDKHLDEMIADGGFRMPVVSQEMRICVVVEGHIARTDDTAIWQRWSLNTAGYEELVQMMRTRPDVFHRTGAAARRFANGLDTRSQAPGVPWWQPSELARNGEGDSETIHGFSRKGSDIVSSLVIGRVEDGLFRCYAYTQCRVLALDPCDGVWRVLRLPLPSSARNVHYETSSNIAGDVSWIRFDLPSDDVTACLAQTPVLPKYAESTADAAVKEYLETSYHAGAPPWWHPGELSAGVYALRRNNTKILADICVGLARLPGENIRVYIGGFSAW